MVPIALENLAGAMASAARLFGDGVIRTSVVERLLDEILCEACSVSASALVGDTNRTRGSRGTPADSGGGYEWVELQSVQCVDEIVSRRYELGGRVPGIDRLSWLCDVERTKVIGPVTVVTGVMVVAFADRAAHARFDATWTRLTGVVPRWGSPSTDVEPYRHFVGRKIHVAAGRDLGRPGFVVDVQVRFGMPWFIIDLDRLHGDRIECAHGRIMLSP